MKLRHLNESNVDVWPAFTDFLTSVLFIVVLFVLGVFFANISRSLLADNHAYKLMQERQRRVQQELKKLGGLEVPEADGNLQRIILLVDKTGSGGVLFPSGRAVLGKEGERLLDKIVKVLVANKDAYHTIQVEGHTDDFPLGAGNQYPSNWELSAARAGAVVNHLLNAQSSLEPWRFSANGRAEYRPYGVEEGLMMKSTRNNTNPRHGPGYQYVIRANGGKATEDNPAAQRNRRIEIILTYEINPITSDSPK